MKHPEKNFWIYASLLVGVFTLLASGPLISCAKAERPHASTLPHYSSPKPSPPQIAPWNQPGPSIVRSPGVRLHAQLDRGAILHNRDGTVRVEVQLETDSQDDSMTRQSSDIVVVVDTSGSMAGEKLRFAQEAIVTLVNRLEPGDRLGLVEYSSSARVLATLHETTSFGRDRLRDLAYNLHPAGSTNMSEGLDRGIQLLEASRQTGRPGRLLLLSDGLANAGDSSISGLNARAQRLSAGGFALSTMGIGHDFDEQIMTSLATSGTGAFYYLAQLDFLPEFFEAELNSAKNTYAQAAVLRFVPGPGVRVQSAMGLPLQNEQGAVAVRLGNLYASRSRTIWLTLTVPTYSLGQKSLGRLSVSYNRAGEQNQIAFGELPKVACLDDEYRYEQHIHRSVWERALLDDVFAKTEEEFGDAIRTGSRGQLADALSRAKSERKLAERLGSTKIVSEIDSLTKKAGEATVAQSAPAAARNSSAKKSKAQGYQKRNKALYDSADRAMEAY